MLKRIWKFLRRHNLITLGAVTAISILFELSLFPDATKSFLDWWSDLEHRRWIVFLVFSSWLILFSGILLWRFLNWNLTPSTYKERQDLLQLVVQVLGGAIIIFGVYATWRNLQVVQQNFELAQQGQLSDRFTKAIDQLGKNEPQVRLGGIYALEGIGNSHSKEYYPQIIQIFSAYIRMNSAWPLRSKSQIKDKENQSAVPIDIQAMLTFIGQYPASENRSRIDLSKTNLHNANLRKPIHQDMNLENVNFREIHTHQADFSGALLRGADFQKSILEETIFTGAKLDQAIFTEAKMLGVAVLVNASLRGATFIGAHLENAQFGNSDVEGANLMLALLPGADLQKAKNLTQQQVDSACMDERTKLPAGLHLSSKKIVKRNGQTFCE